MKRRRHGVRDRATRQVVAACYCALTADPCGATRPSHGAGVVEDWEVKKVVAEKDAATVDAMGARKTLVYVLMILAASVVSNAVMMVRFFPRTCLRAWPAGVASNAVVQCVFNRAADTVLPAATPAPPPRCQVMVVDQAKDTETNGGYLTDRSGAALRTDTSKQVTALTSALPDSYFRRLDSFDVAAPKGSLHMRVTGFA